MAAYGALVSVMQIIDQIHRHPHPPISLHREQVESLTANLTFLQEFLEGYNPQISYTSEADPLESRIAEATYAAEDVIESYIVDQIQAQSTTDHGGKISSAQFYQGLNKVIEEMDQIKMEAAEMKEKKIQGVQIIKKQPTTEAASAVSSSTAQKVTTMVGLDDVFYDMLDKITGGGSVRQIIPIVGMGGLGKTTLARNIYAHQLVKEHFDTCAWSTISQVHNARQILSEILGQVGLDTRGDLSDGELGLKLYKHLIGRRYLIVMDDMWTIEAWDKVRSFFPENENGSRVIVTTRLSNLASKFNYSDLGLDMKFMDEATSWNLFCKTVFEEGICPPELEDIGKKIVGGCRGLPLSIVVVGGLLSKSQGEKDWEPVAESLNSTVNSEDEGRCSQILYMSDNNLPVHIKPCFLYMGCFPEDYEILVPDLNKLWVAEGFLKPCHGKSLEEVAEESLKQLVDRNLVLVGKRSYLGKLKSCRVHDLLRDVCLREARKSRFLSVLGGKSTDGMNSQRRIQSMIVDSPTRLPQSLESASLVRSLIGQLPSNLLSKFRLLRVTTSDPYLEKDSDGDYIM